MRDDLATWCRVRAEVPWRTVVPPTVAPAWGVRDGFADHFHGTGERAAQMRAAAERMSLAAATAPALTPDLLADWQATVLNTPIKSFRTGIAYAKGGRERYGLDAGTPDRFARCLAEADEETVPVAARAARVYLDVAFFHPFDDGNARSAALALQFVLLRGRVRLDLVTPILVTVRRADDAEGAADLARLLHGAAAATARRGPAAQHSDHGPPD